MEGADLGSRQVGRELNFMTWLKNGIKQQRKLCGEDIHIKLYFTYFLQDSFNLFFFGIHHHFQTYIFENDMSLPS